MMQERLRTLTPYLRVALDSNLDAGFFLPERVIFDYELLFIKEGEACITVRDKKYQGKRGDWFLFRPGVPHSIRVSSQKTLRQPHLHFDLQYRSESPSIGVSFRPFAELSLQERELIAEDVVTNIFPDIPDRFRPQDAERMEALLFSVIREHQSCAPYYEMRENGLLLELLGTLFSSLDTSRKQRENSHYEEMADAKAYIDAYYQQPITLELLAKRAHLSKYYFNRIFTETFSVTPIHYLRQVRLTRAKELLRFTALSVTSIAEQSGFSSEQVFSRYFRHAVGMTPGRYRSHM